MLNFLFNLIVVFECFFIIFFICFSSFVLLFFVIERCIKGNGIWLIIKLLIDRESLVIILVIVVWLEICSDFNCEVLIIILLLIYFVEYWSLGF